MTAMGHAAALFLARELVEHMQPHCERIQIAGSLRRGVRFVKDIEIVAIPHFEERKHTVGLFGEEETQRFNMLYDWGQRARDDRIIEWIKPGTDRVQAWPLKPDGKYWRGLLPQGVKVDVFLCEPSNWGAILLLRTGSADFMEAIVTHAKRIGHPMDGGRFHRHGLPVETPEEADVFRLLRLQYVAPPDRRGACDVIKVNTRALRVEPGA